MDGKGGSGGGVQGGSGGVGVQGGGGSGAKGSGGAGSGGMMKAPGGDGSYISRDGFESNPQGYFSGQHAGEKASGGGRGGGGVQGGGGSGAKGSGGSGGGAGSGGMMKAPGGDGSYISRDGFESNPQGYFSGLHAGEKANK
ncbi:glycine-rich protein DOT1-like [Cornus florida]|uniref:glycine-rich protein DOT1-like n=1 Tax=Cornus florida TaxID=4283 RepID=UPI00289F72FB|nr:glycine-rich protein DOT1-like [Cornus florida]